MIEDVFRILKADRYTKDGCDEIQKAKDTLAEDEKYNIGDISKKTGLMKTANGWVEPKKARAGAGKPNQEKARKDGGSKPTESKPANTEWETKGKYQIKKFENENDLDKFLKSNGYLYKDDGGTSFSEKGQIHETVYKKGNETLVKAVGPGIKKPTIRRKSSPSTESKPAERDLKKELWSDIKKREGALHAKGKWRNLEDDPEYAQLMKQYKEMDEDAAPRKLTGDCKIRIRK